MACDAYYLQKPSLLAEQMADTLHVLWSLDISECPCKQPLKRRLESVLTDSVIQNSLPKAFLSNKGVTGLIDLGKAGVADPWQDIALCVRSLDDNYSSKYGGIKLDGFDVKLLFDALEIPRDLDLNRYYIQLDELF